MKAGNRVAKGAIEFNDEDCILFGAHLVGFTICEEDDNPGNYFVMFPASEQKKSDGTSKPYYFLRGSAATMERIEDKIIEAYESVIKHQDDMTVNK